MGSPIGGYPYAAGKAFYQAYPLGRLKKTLLILWSFLLTGDSFFRIFKPLKGGLFTLIEDRCKHIFH